ncbi:hypothetical protein K456DRAFT_1627574 [Colletotrichum gloeosporioides 23]|nr:hypothetical protein K456DRAFT_1627574 [Colletotrichum gloeosporioides 23]
MCLLSPVSLCPASNPKAPPEREIELERERKKARKGRRELALSFQRKGPFNWWGVRTSGETTVSLSFTSWTVSLSLTHSLSWYPSHPARLFSSTHTPKHHKPTRGHRLPIPRPLGPPLSASSDPPPLSPAAGPPQLGPRYFTKFPLLPLSITSRRPWTLDVNWIKKASPSSSSPPTHLSHSSIPSKHSTDLSSLFLLSSPVHQHFHNTTNEFNNDTRVQVDHRHHEHLVNPIDRIERQYRQRAQPSYYREEVTIEQRPLALPAHSHHSSGSSQVSGHSLTSTPSTPSALAPRNSRRPSRSPKRLSNPPTCLPPT